DPTTPVAEVVEQKIDNFHDEAEVEWEGTRVIGKVTFAPGKVRRRPVRMGADQFCQNFHDQVVLSEGLVTHGDGDLQYALVYVKEGLPAGQSWPVPENPAVIDQKGCMYIPHVIGVRAGQAIKILNSDNTLHNVKATPSRNSGFNEGMPVPGMVLNKSFSKPELGVPLKCDVHPWMNAYVHVLDHPFFYVTGEQGAFEILGLPPGEYTLEAWQESSRVPPVTFKVTVKENRSVRADVELAPE
ncbi:MAG: carboxypeptidase regulatory-like domain-containing protein, partial [Phycisphaeraceae bacterium]|nr:carboxypeptidase regulatory-like domain-containing protein [Phycisphaeraceae bacterium]